MSDLNIAIVLGSTRPGRNRKAVADRVVDNAAARQRRATSWSTSPITRHRRG